MSNEVFAVDDTIKFAVKNGAWSKGETGRIRRILSPGIYIIMHEDGRMVWAKGNEITHWDQLSLFD